MGPWFRGCAPLPRGGYVGLCGHGGHACCVSALIGSRCENSWRDTACIGRTKNTWHVKYDRSKTPGSVVSACRESQEIMGECPQTPLVFVFRDLSGFFRERANLVS